MMPQRQEESIPSLQLLQPNGTVLGQVLVCASVGLLEPQTLPRSGTYTIFLDPVGTSTGTVSVNVYDVVDVATSIAINGSAITAALTTPGQNARLPFTGTAGQRVSVAVTVTSGGFGCTAPIQIRKAVDDSVVASVQMCGNTGFLDPVTLPASGGYIAVVDPIGASTGTATVNLYDVVDVTTPIVANASAVTAALTTPGQKARLPFTGTAGHAMSVNVVTTSGAFGCTTPIQIRKAADDTQIGTVSMCGSAGFLDPLILPANDSYVVVVDPIGSTTGTATINLYDVVDVTTPIVAGSSVSAALTTPGQNARLPSPVRLLIE